CCHQFLALLGHVGWKYRLDLRRDREQAIIEDRGGLIGDRCDSGEALLNEFDLVGCHVSLLCSTPRPASGTRGRRTTRPYTRASARLGTPASAGLRRR